MIGGSIVFLRINDPLIRRTQFPPPFSVILFRILATKISKLTDFSYCKFRGKKIFYSSLRSTGLQIWIVKVENCKTPEINRFVC